MAYFGTLAPYIAPQGGPNGVNHISMYLGYHNIEIKTRDILKLNFGIWMIDCMKRGLYVNDRKATNLMRKLALDNCDFDDSL